VNRTPIKFRILVLAACMVAGALLTSVHIAFFAAVPPVREVLGEEGFRRAWTLIPLTGAFVGAMVYTILAVANNLPMRQFSLRALLIAMTLVCLAVAFLVYAVKGYSSGARTGLAKNGLGLRVGVGSGSDGNLVILLLVL
jgi:hypothetical protein